MNFKIISFSATVVALAMATACGGGGGSTKAVTDPTTSTTVEPLSITVPAYAASNATTKVWAMPQAGVSYVWTISGDGSAKITSGQGTNAITISGYSITSGIEKMTVSLTAQAADSGASESRSETFVVTPPPGMPALTPSSVSIQTTQPFTLAANASGANPLTYSWTVQGGYVEAGVGTDTLSLIAPNTSGTITATCLVTDSVTGLTNTATKTLTVSANPNPGPYMPTITGPSGVNVSTDPSVVYAFSTTAQAGCTYTWNCPGMVVSSGQGTTNVSFSAPSPDLLTEPDVWVTVSLTMTNANGSVTATKQVHVI